ncbi:MAG: HNH endonuclease signature motif containing protein [Arthrobacter sp.]
MCVCNPRRGEGTGDLRLAVGCCACGEKWRGREEHRPAPVVQDPATGEILHIGRRRRVPAGLKRWLQARDGTCRFPGCGVSVSNSEIDHTRPWAWGGETSHGNLEHLCPKHHRLKTLAYWKAAQPEPGVIAWTSPGGLRRRTGPMLDYGSGRTPAQPFPADRGKPPDLPFPADGGIATDLPFPADRCKPPDPPLPADGGKPPDPPF